MKNFSISDIKNILKDDRGGYLSDVFLLSLERYLGKENIQGIKKDDLKLSKKFDKNLDIMFKKYEINKHDILIMFNLKYSLTLELLSSLVSEN